MWGTSHPIVRNSTADTFMTLLQHCRNLAPEYEKTAKSFNSLVPLYAIDCDAEENKPLCGQQVGRLLRILGHCEILIVRVGCTRIPHSKSTRKSCQSHFMELTMFPSFSREGPKRRQLNTGASVPRRRCSVGRWVRFLTGSRGSRRTAMSQNG